MWGISVGATSPFKGGKNADKPDKLVRFIGFITQKKGWGKRKRHPKRGKKELCLDSRNKSPKRGEIFNHFA